MKGINDLNEMLEIEILSEMADSFFGSRKKIDNMLEMIDAFVVQLKGKKTEVVKKAGFLNYLFIDETAVKAFYEKAAPHSSTWFLSCGFPIPNETDYIPFAFTVKGTYYKLVFSAYESLQAICDEYNYGKPFDDTGPKDTDPICVNREMVEQMIRLVTEQIASTNTYMAPEMVLSSFGRFNPAQRGKETIAGAPLFSENGSGLDSKMRFNQIDPSQFNIEKIPHLPELDDIMPHLKSVCDHQWRVHHKKIREIVSLFKQM